MRARRRCGTGNGSFSPTRTPASRCGRPSIWTLPPWPKSCTGWVRRSAASGTFSASKAPARKTAPPDHPASAAGPLGASPYRRGGTDHLAGAPPARNWGRRGQNWPGRQRTTWRARPMARRGYLRGGPSVVRLPLVPQRHRFDDRDAVGGVGPERAAAERRGRELVRLAVVEPGARVVRAVREGVGLPVERVPRVDAERPAVRGALRGGGVVDLCGAAEVAHHGPLFRA